MPRKYVKKSGARKAHCGYKYNKKTKSWGYSHKNGAACVPGKGTAQRHSNISKRSVGGMMGHFGRLRRERSERRKIAHTKPSHESMRGVKGEGMQNRKGLSAMAKRLLG